MNTVRRIYFYLLSLISAEVVIWGVVNLVRTIALRRTTDIREALATGLSLLLVGIPIFLIHWRVAQRDALRDAEERASRVRAVFLYAALFATLSPMIYALLAIVNRALGGLMGLETSQLWFGEEGIAADNIIALIINTAAFAYFWKTIRDDWRADTPEHFLDEARRLYRYIWVVSGLTLAVSAVYNLLRYALLLLSGFTEDLPAILAGGIALLIVGAPLLAFFWSMVQASLISPIERRSLLRLIVLYLISLSGVIGVLNGAGAVLSGLIRWIAGASTTFTGFLEEYSGAIGAAVPLGLMWWYFSGVLNREVGAITDQPRREALRRLYYYILSLFGLGAAYIGLISLINFFSRLLFERDISFANLRGDMSDALALLLVGFPLWWVCWRAMQGEAARRDESGDHARRSVIRKAYLYLVLFFTVIGAMIFAGQIVYNLLNALLTGSRPSLAQEISFLAFALTADVAILVYHWRVLRQDGKIAQQITGNLHAAFPTLILLDGSEPFSQAFADALLTVLPRVIPRLPVAVHRVERGAPDEPMLQAKAILLSTRLAMHPPESLRLWLDEYRGRRILIPSTEGDWHWLGVGEKRPQELAREAVQSLRQMAEGEAVRHSQPIGPWAVVGIVLGGLFALQLFFIFFGVVLNAFF